MRGREEGGTLDGERESREKKGGERLEGREGKREKETEEW